MSGYCSACHRATAKRWRENNPEKHAAYNAEWARNNTEKFREYAAAYRERHPDRVRAAATKYAKANPQKRSEIESRRRARRRAATIEAVDYDYILQRDGCRCHLCGTLVAPSDLHFDHLVPLARGGSHTVENIRVAHAVCNMRRGAGRLPAQLLLVG